MIERVCLKYAGTEVGTAVKHNERRDKCPGVIQHASVLGAGTVKLLEPM